MLAALRERGIHLEPQVLLKLPGYGPAHLDGADRRLRWGVEVDHVTWHGGRIDAQRDKARDRAARRINWLIERVTDQEVTVGLAQVINELEDSYRRRTRELR